MRSRCCDEERNLRIMRFSSTLPQELATEMRVPKRARRSAGRRRRSCGSNRNGGASVSRREPTEAEWHDLVFAWDVVRHVKSNGIVVARNGVTRGICAGQTNRVSAVEIATARAGESARGAACASDGFFPFADGIEAAIAAGCAADHRARRLDSRRGGDRRRRPRRDRPRLFVIPVFSALGSTRKPCRDICTRRSSSTTWTSR